MNDYDKDRQKNNFAFVITAFGYAILNIYSRQETLKRRWNK